MKLKKLIANLMAFGLSFSLVACNQSASSSSDSSSSEATVPTSIVIDQSEAVVDSEEDLSLSFTLTPANAKTTLTWSSEDETVATVTNNGTIRGHYYGTTRVSAETSNGLKASCEVTCEPYKAGKYKMIYEKGDIQNGALVLLAATYNDESGERVDSYWPMSLTQHDTYRGITEKMTAVDGALTIMSSSEAEAFVVQVDEKGYTFKCHSGYLAGSDSYQDPGLFTKPVLDDSCYFNIFVYNSLITIELANAQSMYSLLTYEDAIDGITISNHSSGNELALFQKDVLPFNPFSIELNSTSLNLHPSETSVLMVSYEPYYTNVKKATWKSTDENVATVSNEGEVTAIKTGEASIIVTVESLPSSLSASCRVAVTNIPVTGIKLSSSSKTVRKGYKANLGVNISPSNATDQAYTYRSEDPSIASISEEGVITGNALGETRITVNSHDGLFTDSCEVVVNDEVDALTIMVYMSGGHYESYYGMASDNIAEMIAGSSNDKVNLILETGGAANWSGELGIANDSLGRYHIEDGMLCLDDSLPSTSMGETDTFSSFLTWGLTNYPALSTGVILWGNSAFTNGVLDDALYNDDYLSNSEMSHAYRDAFSHFNRGEKLDWLGYDGGVGAMQDLATYQAPYFKYLFASASNEYANGWDYSAIMNAAADKPGLTPLEMGKVIADSTVGSIVSSSSTITISVLDLGKAEAYQTAFEKMATEISSLSSTEKHKEFTNLFTTGIVSMNSLPENSGYDVMSLVNELSKMDAYKNMGSLSEVTSALNAFVVYLNNGEGIPNCSGLSAFYPDPLYASATDYLDAETSFHEWRELVCKAS